MTLTAIVVLSALTACASPAPKPAPVEHLVFVWLKDRGNAEHIRALEEASRSFSIIPGIQQVETGRALASNRPIVDSSYDLAIRIRFDSAEALGAYATHPLHVEKREQVLVPLVDRLQIYDFRINFPYQ